jgi:hypothetical protein
MDGFRERRGRLVGPALGSNVGLFNRRLCFDGWMLGWSDATSPGLLEALGLSDASSISWSEDLSLGFKDDPSVDDTSLGSIKLWAGPIVGSWEGLLNRRLEASDDTSSKSAITIPAQLNLMVRIKKNTSIGSWRPTTDTSGYKLSHYRDSDG